MPSLTKQQIDMFLTTGAHLMELATLTPEGWPYVIPVRYEYDGEAFYISGRTKARWVAHIQNDPRVSVCIDSEDAAHTRVQVQGSAEVVDIRWFGDWLAKAIRYAGEEAGRRYHAETKHIPRARVRLTPHKVTTWTGPGWHPRYTEGVE